MRHRGGAFTRVLTGLCLAWSALTVGTAAAQHVFEFRAADTKYRYADWNFTFSNGAVADVFYVGVPGSNEFNLGGGYSFRRGTLSVTPLLYFVGGKEGGQRGVKLALLVIYEKGGWKLASFLGHFAHLSGEVANYQVLDTLDITRAFRKRWEAGLSNGFFHTGKTWNPQVGPLLKLNDSRGYWGASYRFGPQREFRVVRVFVF
jgi:hypothetical protein